MAELPWKLFQKPAAQKEYLALLSYLPLRSLWSLPQFLYFTRRVRHQLDSARGLIGYSLLAHVFATRFWTLSVWEDEVALMDFVHKQPHREAMMLLRRYMGGAEFVRWKIKGSAVPPSWHEAMERARASAAAPSVGKN